MVEGGGAGDGGGDVRRTTREVAGGRCGSKLAGARIL